MIKTFRGLLADGEQEKIRLSTKNGKIGYKIIKFQLIGPAPGTTAGESTVKIFKVTQTSVTGDIDFSDGNLLAAAFWSNHNTATNYTEDLNVIFEQEVFNQDIFITHDESNSSAACNYYLELETINLTDNAAVVSTLRDIRLNPQVGA
tara:strand:+ start:249 stop:692 length:444 start_codon:yes stop_codon:yes gene_type:complete